MTRTSRTSRPRDRARDHDRRDAWPAGSFDDSLLAPLWLDTPDRPAPRAAASGVVHADLLVVGGGFTGLWTALRAVERDPGLSVVLVEGDRIAVRYARKNAQRAGLANVECVGHAVESWMAEGYPDGADRVIADPPRTGLPFLALKLLVARPARRLTYVSCHPAALARDLAELAAAYRVESIVLADLFPQTGQMEAIVELVARDGGSTP